MPQERGVIKMIVTNFINSLRPRQIKGNLIGKDHFGNKYFEIPPNLAIGKPRKERWFEPQTKEKFDQEMPAEWEAWLRGRRREPPSEEEVLKNVAIAEMKKKNAAELDIKERGGDSQTNQSSDIKTTSLDNFPRYPEYEVMPGKNQDEK